MSARSQPRPGRRHAIWALLGGGLLLFGAANAHLVYVALRSQPDCVDHVKPGLSGGEGGLSAAKSACAPR